MADAQQPHRGTSGPYDALGGRASAGDRGNSGGGPQRPPGCGAIGGHAPS
jgi:hypothetical protein